MRRKHLDLVKEKMALRGRRISAACTTGAIALVAIFATMTAPAQEKDTTDSKTSVESEFRFSFVGDSEFKTRSNFETGNAYDFATRDVVSFKIREGVLFRFGLEWERFNFSLPDPVPLPSKLQSTTIVLGADVQLGEAWIARLEIQPGFYSGGTGLRGRNFSVPITIGASYFWSSDLQLVAGLSIDPERKYPVLPGVGFRYKCSADWVLDIILPTPRIEYSFSKSILFYAGGEFRGDTYRVDADFGDAHGDPKLNNAVVDYTQIRVGGGASWKIGSDWTMELEAGVVPVQELDFHRADFKARSTQIPPYGGIVLKADF